MNNNELVPTKENLIDTVYNDTIDRNKDIVYFYNILQSQKTTSSIAIDGKWGSGKTFFVKQTQLVITALNLSSTMDEETKEQLTARLPFTKDEKENNYNSLVAIYYDAWENDNDTDPILSILYEITKQLSIDFSLTDKKIFKAAGSIIDAISGRNTTKILDALSADDPYTKFKNQKEIEENIKTFLSNLLEERANRLIIFIDELDRCKPDFAIHLLEQIKHYIYDERITFVFSINLEQLQHTVKHYYGYGFDSCRYLDKFFDLRITLPPANMEKFYNQLGLNTSYWIDIISKRIINMLNLQLREITRFHSQVTAAVYKPTHNDNPESYLFSSVNKSQKIILLCIVPLLIGLNLTDSSLYTNFVNGKNVTPLKELFKNDDAKSLLHDMLNPNEVLDSQEGKTLISCDQLIERFYDAIFVTRYTRINYQTRMGDYVFDKYSKNFALEAANMMTPFAKL